MRGDVSMHPPRRGDEHWAVTLDVPKYSGTNLNIMGYDGIEKMDVASFFDHDTMTTHVADVITTRADHKFTCAINIAGYATVDGEVSAINF